MEVLRDIEFLWLPNDLYDYCLKHTDVMNSWKNDKELIKEYPSLNRDFTVKDAFIDLVAKGFIAKRSFS